MEVSKSISNVYLNYQNNDSSCLTVVYAVIRLNTVCKFCRRKDKRVMEQNSRLHLAISHNKVMQKKVMKSFVFILIILCHLK